MTATTRSHTILLIDDHPAVRQGLAALLASCGFPTPAQASTPEEAAAVLETTGIDLAILDLSLEQGSGLDIVPDLTGRGVRVIVYSMFEDARTIKRALDFGALGYVTKRDEPADLLAAVDRVLSGEAYLSARATRAVEAASAIDKDLSERERQVLALMGQGESNIGIAAALGISVRTVETYYARISEKLELTPGVRDLRKYAIRHFSR